MRVTTHSRRDLESLLEIAGFNSAETAVFAPQPTYAWFDMIGSANQRAAATLPVTTLLDHPLFRKRASAPVLRKVLRLFGSNVAAFAAVASQGPWKSIICELVEFVSSQTRLDIRLPVEGLFVRESKVMIQARCNSTDAPIHISLGMTDAGNSRMLTESTALRSLEHMETIRRERLVVPKVLWRGDFRGQYVGVLSHIDGIPVRPSAQHSDSWDSTKRVLEMLRECSDCDVATNAAITIDDLWNERWQLVEPLWHSSHLRHLAAVTQESLRPSDEEAVKIAKFGHGDLHPQNILVCSDGHTIGTIDWECAGPSHPFEDALACGLGHLRQQHRGIGESIIALVQAIPEHIPPSISSFLPASELEPDRLRTLLAFVWLRRLANAQGTAVLMDPEWLHKRAFCVLESFNNIVRK